MMNRSAVELFAPEERPPSSASSTRPRPWHVLVAAMLLIGAWGIRLVLARRGGQYYVIDEPHRYQPCVMAADLLLRQHWSRALHVLLERQMHIGFHGPGTAVALAVQLVYGVAMREDMWFAAWLLSLSSVAIVGLVYAIARRSGADRTEALLALVFAGGATSLTYYARQLLPYDCGLALGLFALWLALRPGGVLRAATVGATASAAFLTYYGYLFVPVLAAVVHVLRVRNGVVRRAFGVALGALVPFAVLEVASHLQGINPPFHVGVWQSLHTTIEAWGSSFAEGWWVPWAYLWDSEHLALIGWLGAIVVGLRYGSRRAALWGGVVFACYAWMVVLSVVLHEAVVVGRLVRQVVPFLCMAAAAGFASGVARWWPWSAGRRRAALALGVALFAAQAAANLAVPWTQRFPNDVTLEWDRKYPGLSRDVTLAGPSWYGQNMVDRPAPFVAFNIDGVGPWPVVGLKEPSAVGRVLESYPHPLAWRPYQYEGYPPAARAAIRSRPLAMTVVDQRTAGPR